MDFGERVVNTCVRAMSNNIANEMLVQDILQCKHVNVSPIEPFLVDKSWTIRWMAVRIIGEKGNISTLLKAAFGEENKFILAEMLGYLGKRKAEGIEALEGLLKNGDSLIKEAAITMFRRAGKPNSLFPMLFDEDDVTVQRVKRYFDEQEKQDRPASNT